MWEKIKTIFEYIIGYSILIFLVFILVLICISIFERCEDNVEKLPYSYEKQVKTPQSIYCVKQGDNYLLVESKLEVLNYDNIEKERLKISIDNVPLFDTILDDINFNFADVGVNRILVGAEGGSRFSDKNDAYELFGSIDTALTAKYGNRRVLKEHTNVDSLVNKLAKNVVWLEIKTVKAITYGALYKDSNSHRILIDLSICKDWTQKIEYVVYIRYENYPIENNSINY